MKEKIMYTFTQTTYQFFSLKKYVLRFQVEKSMKEGKATHDWDCLHMLIYCWKLFRYCSNGWISVETKIAKIYSLTRTLYFTHLLSFCILFLVIFKTIRISTEVIMLIPKGTSCHPWKNCKNFCEVSTCPGLYKLWPAMKMTCQCNHSCNHFLS